MKSSDYDGVFGEIMKPFSKNIKKFIKFIHINGLYLAYFTVGMAVMPCDEARAEARARACPTDPTVRAEKSDWKLVFGDSKGVDSIYLTCAKGAGVGSWHWSWKAGWIKQCHLMAKGICKDLLSKTAEDHAAMIRRLSYNKMGQIFEGSNDPELLKILQTRFSTPKSENKNIHWVDQMRIMFAIRQIGGKKPLERLDKQGRLDTKQKDYLDRLKRG